MINGRYQDDGDRRQKVGELGLCTPGDMNERGGKGLVERKSREEDY